MFEIWGRPNCIWCDRAKALLEERGMLYEYVELTPDNLEVFQLYFPGKKTVPQIHDIGLNSGCTIGGYEDLVKALT